MSALITTLFPMVVMSSAVWAQGVGTIHGSVKDPSGAAVVNAARDRLTGGARSLENGDHQRTRRIRSASTARRAFSILVESPGFNSFRQGQIELTANENVRIDAQLKLGDVSESIAVTADAPQADSRSSVLGTLIDSRRLLEIPTNGRNVMALEILLPGVSQATAAAPMCRSPARAPTRTCICSTEGPLMRFSATPA